MEDTENNMLERLDDLMLRAKQQGADGADAVYVHGVSLSTSQRMGQPEHLERAEGADIGLRILIGKRQAIASTSNISEPGPGHGQSGTGRRVLWPRAGKSVSR